MMNVMTPPMMMTATAAITVLLMAPPETPWGDGEELWLKVLALTESVPWL